MEHDKLIPFEEERRRASPGFVAALLYADAWDERPPTRRLAGKLLFGLWRAFVIVLRAIFLWLRFPTIWALEVLARLGIFMAVMSFLFYWVHDKPDQDTVVLMTGFLGIGINMASYFLLWLYELFLDSIWSETRL